MVFIQQRIFFWQWFFDFHYELRLIINFFWTIYQFGASFFVFLVRNAASQTGAIFYKHGMSMFQHLLHAHRDEGYAVFIGLDFFGYANNHVSFLFKKVVASDRGILNFSAQ